MGRKINMSLNRRKHMSAGSILVRMCIRESYAPESRELHAPQLFCPVCQLWPAITQLVPAGEKAGQPGACCRSSVHSPS